MIESLRHTKDGYDLAKRDYWRDDRDRILAWKRGSDTFHNGMEDGRGDRYRYDPEGQLDLASYRVANPELSPGVPLRSDEFHYDALGNRMGSNRVASRGVMNFERDDNKLNQYRAWWPYSVTNYDDDLEGWGEPGEANGVMMQDGWITASFNALNQPMGIWSPTYNGTGNNMWFGYDPLGRCVKRWVAPYGAPSTNATYYYYDGWNLVQEGPSGGTEARVYVHGGRTDEIVASWGNSQWYHHHYDAQGHCIMLTGTNGGVQEQYDYDAFGLPYIYRADGTPVALKLGSPAGNRFLFTGREWLKDHRLYDYRNRLYQPELGRFLQPDPKEFAAGDYNLYRYCHNDPVNRMDPTGLQASSSDEILNKPNLTALGQGDWMRAGSPFTNGEMLGKVKEYVGAIRSTVENYVSRANAASRNVRWSANVSNWLKSREYFKNPRAIATADWSTKSAAVMNANATVGSFNVNLQININWNASQSAYFGNALRMDNTSWRGKTGEIEHPRDALKALSSSYGGARPAGAIANDEAASMVGQSIPEGAASSRMDGALADWARLTRDQSRIDHDDSREHSY